MEHIQDIYKEKPDLIENLLKNHVSKINLKVDGKPFQVLYNEETDELEFHGRSGNETTVGPLITDIDRYFSKFVNDAIRHIEARADLFKKYKFMTIEIIDNELLLTSVITKSGEFVNSPKEIRKIADELETEVMPTLWEGQLSDSQINTLMDIIKTGDVPTKSEFIKVVKELFDKDPNFPKKLIMANTEFIEGIVFFFDVKGKIVEYKLVDPAFRAQSAGYKASSKAEKDKNKDAYNKLYEFFLEWVENNGEKLADNRIHSIEKNFIKMMSDPKTYNKVMNLASGVRINNIARYGVQLDRTTPELAKEIRKKGDLYKTIYEIFFNMFKKPKKRNYTINKEFQMKVNDAIELFESLDEDEIFESEDGESKFDKAFENESEALNYFLSNCVKDKNIDEKTVKAVFKLAFEDCLSTKPFRFSTNAAKLARVYGKDEEFVDKLSKISGVTVSDVGFKIGDIMIKFGNGSVDRLSTPDQENGTCNVWNNYITGTNIGETDDIQERIANVAASITYGKESKKFPKDWQSSFIKQTTGIIEFCESQNIDPAEYRLDRRNNGKLAKAYYELNKKYTELISNGEGSIDNYDPSDVILYKLSEEPNIIDTLKDLYGKCANIKSPDELITVKNEYLNNLFRTKKCIGVSLKKISGKKNHQIDIMNSSDKDIKTNVTKYKDITSKTANNVMLECFGTFVLNHLTDPDNGKPLEEKENSMLLTLRSFNTKGDENQIAMDVMLNKKEPSLGKVAKREWLNVIKDNYENYSERSSFKLEETLNAFKKHFNPDNSTDDLNDSKKCKELTTFIESAMKVGGSCFPYIIIH